MTRVLQSYRNDDDDDDNDDDDEVCGDRRSE